MSRIHKIPGPHFNAWIRMMDNEVCIMAQADSIVSLAAVYRHMVPGSGIKAMGPTSASSETIRVVSPPKAKIAVFTDSLCPGYHAFVTSNWPQTYHICFQAKRGARPVPEIATFPSRGGRAPDSLRAARANPDKTMAELKSWRAREREEGALSPAAQFMARCLDGDGDGYATLPALSSAGIGSYEPACNGWGVLRGTTNDGVSWVYWVGEAAVFEPISWTSGGNPPSGPLYTTPALPPGTVTEARAQGGPASLPLMVTTGPPLGPLPLMVAAGRVTPGPLAALWGHCQAQAQGRVSALVLRGPPPLIPLGCAAGEPGALILDVEGPAPGPPARAKVLDNELGPDVRARFPVIVVPRGGWPPRLPCGWAHYSGDLGYLAHAPTPLGETWGFGMAQSLGLARVRCPDATRPWVPGPK
jgi:hypothetical protein